VSPSRPIVRVLSTPGCGNASAAVAVCRDVMTELGLPGGPDHVVLTEDAEARRLGFRGSPTVTVDGRDVQDEPEGKPGLHWG